MIPKMFGSFLAKQRHPLICWRLAGKRPLKLAEIWQNSRGSLCQPASKAARLVFLLISWGAASTITEESFQNPTKSHEKAQMLLDK